MEVNITKTLLHKYTQPEKLAELGISILDKLVIVVAMGIAGFFIIKLVDRILAKIFDKTEIERTLEIFIHKTVVSALWILFFFALLGIIGVDIGALVASLGIMGFVLGFALKDTLGNFASGVMILFNEPFKVGDYIKTKDFSGTVKTVAMSYTRIITPDNQKVTIPNSVIWGTPIINYSAYSKRRINFTVDVAYESNFEKAIQVIRKIISKDKRILKDPEPFIKLTDLSSSSVKIGVRVWTKRKDYFATMTDLKASIKKEFDKNKIEIPYQKMEVSVKK